MDTAVSAFLLSFGISYFLYFIVILPISFIFVPFLSAGYDVYSYVEFNEPIYLLFYTLVASFQFLLAYLFFKIRRFKNGFPFIFEKYTIIIVLIATGIILTIVSLFTTPRDSYENTYIILSLIVGVIIVGVGIYIWIRRSIKLFVKKQGITQNEELHQQEMDELRRELQRYKDNHETVRAANHNIVHRLTTAERTVLRLLEIVREYELPAETCEELTILLTDIRNMLEEYMAEVDRAKVNIKLPSTNIQMIDDLFELFAERFKNNGIDFNLKVNGSIIHMTDTMIAKSKLETLIGDHLQDALVAVNASKTPVRNVLAMIGAAGGCYEFSVHDSGIPFDLDTLTRLGTERVTTHGDKGGSGVGFMKTFETMRECRASLIITEKEPGSGFSKIVTIRFDNENKYIIETYRPDEFPPSDRYSVIGQG